MSSQPIHTVLTPEQIAAVRKPVDEASVPPLEIYTSREFFEIERERVFLRTWQVVGREEDLAKPGDYITARILDEPLIVVRGRDDEIRALSNVCRHRGTQLLQGCGHVPAIVCPYHRWTYALDGALRGAPWMQNSKGFDKTDVQLPSFKVETWNGFIFVNLDANAAPLGPQLAPLTEALAPYNMSEMRAVEMFQRDAPWNWKVSMENFTEAYHHIGVHAKSIGDALPVDRVIYEDTNDAYSLFYIRGKDGPPQVRWRPFPEIQGLTPRLMESSTVFNVYPTLHMLADSGAILWLDFDIRSEDDHTLRWKTLVPQSTLALPDFQERLENYKAGFLRIIEEDIDICTKVRQAHKSRFFTPGRYCDQEKSVQQLHRWLLDLTEEPTRR